MKYFAFSLLVSLSVGCGENLNRSATAPVSGIVTFDGQPLASGTIIFETAGSRPASGVIKEGAILNVTTYKFNDGVPVGLHKISITATETEKKAVMANPGEMTAFDPNYMGGGNSLIPPKYNNPTTSGLTAKIKSGTENVIQLKLESDKKKI